MFGQILAEKVMLMIAGFETVATTIPTRVT